MNPYFGLQFLDNLPDADVLAQQKRAVTSLPVVGNAIVAGVPTVLGPDPRLTDITGGPHALNYIPGAGAVETGAAILGSGVNALGNLRNYITGRNDDWHLPGMETINKLGENVGKTEDELQQQVAAAIPALRAPDPNDPVDVGMSAVGSLTSLGGVGKIAGAGARLAHAFGTSVPLYALQEAANSVDEANAKRDEARRTGIQPAQPVVVDAAEQLARDNATVPPTQTAEARTSVASDTRPPIVDIGLGGTQTKQPKDIGLGGTTQGGPVDIGLGGAGQDADMHIPMQQGQGIGSVPVWGSLAALLGVGLAVRGARRVREQNAAATEAARTARLSDPAYAAQAQDFNNAQIAKGAGAASLSGDQTPAPLPTANVLRTGLNRVNDKILDKTAAPQEIIRNLGDPTTSQSLAHEYGQLHDDGAVRVKYDAFLDTGYHPEAQVQIPPPVRVDRNISRLSDPQRTVFAEGMGAADELDNRKNNLAEFYKNNPGGTPTPDDIRHNLKNYSDADLLDAQNKMMADPATASIATDMWAQAKGMREISEKMNVLPAAERATLDAAHPHYLPETDTTGKTMRPLSQRDRTMFTGVDQVNPKPWLAHAQAMEDMHREIDLRAERNKLYTSLSEAQTRYPDAAKIFTDVPGPTGKPVYYSGGDARERVVALHTRAGTKYVHIAHPDVYNMFTNDSLKKTRISTEALTVPRRIYQNFTTGTGSLLSGSFAAGRNLAYTIPAMAINTPKGFNAGLIHKGVRAATGGRWDSGLARGADMFTNLGYIPYSYARGVAERRGRNIGNVLRPEATNSINRLLRNTFDDATVNRMQAAGEKFYRDSATYRARADYGIGGGGLGPKSELQPLGVESGMRASIAAAQHVPELYHSGEWMGTRPFTIKLHQAVMEALSNISDAGHMASFRLNENNPNIGKAQLGRETRALTGNPTARGSSEILKRVTDALPFTNISMQGEARFGRSLGERPLNSTMAIVGGFGTLKLIELLTAMQSPQTLKNYEDELSNQEHATRINIYLPGGKVWPIPIAQEFQIPVTYLGNLIANATNVIAMQHDPLSFQSVEKMITDFLGSHISTASVNQMKFGAANLVSPFAGHPWIGQFDPYKMMQGQGLWGSFQSPWTGGPVSGSHNLPDQVPDGALEGKEGQMWTKVMGAIFGLTGSAMAEAKNGYDHYVKQFGNWADAVGQVGHDWMKRAGDRNPLLAPVMDMPMRLSLMPPIVEQTERDLKWMKQISGSRTEPSQEGMTGRGRSALPVYTSGDKKIPTDPTMLFLWHTIEGANRRVKLQEDDIGALRKQMNSVAGHGMDVAKREEWMKAKTRELADKYRFIQNVIQDTNYTMSKALNRRVYVGQNIKWQEGPEQFNNAE